MTFPDKSCQSRSMMTLATMALLIVVSLSGFHGVQSQDTLVVLQDPEAVSGGDAKIEEVMDEMKSAGRSFRRALRGKKVEDALKHAQRAQLATLKSKDLVPDRVSELEDPDVRAASLKDYRLMIIVTLEHWLKIERALLDGDLKTAGEEAKKISTVKKSGHEKFRKEED